MNIAALVVVIIILMPFGWLVVASVTPQAELIEVPLRWIPHTLELGRFADIFTKTGNGPAATFRDSLVNSIVVAACSTAIGIFVGVLGGYAFARLKFRGRRVTLLAFLASYMIPPIALVIPLYTVLTSIGLLDSKLGLIVVYCAYVTPFILWILSNYFMTIPADLEEAGLVDGCSRLGALTRIVLPSAKPGIFAAMMFGFILSWDEFLYALIFTSSNTSKTIPVAIAEFSGKHSTDFGLVAAGGVIAALPPVVLAIMFQRYVVSGLTAGGIKG